MCFINFYLYLCLIDAEGIVEEVVLLGAPVSGCEEDWSRLERVVSGRIVNGFCRQCCA